MRQDLLRRLTSLERAPLKAHRGVQDMSDDELVSIFDEHLVETPAGMVPFREASEADQNRYLEAVAAGAA
ncbi:hypothetical protein [Methanoculleus sp.]|uniref:hypothetical protein n=1 Tax=Methanoculleus sp. TaxID=90427 RepID=UPI001BD3EB12|nr:hypothetical protein [Methanoculleus sp.]